MADRRCAARTPFRKRVRFGSSNSQSWGFTSNISGKGIRIEARQVLSPRSKILINIHMGKDGVENGTMEEIIKLEGVVVWVSPTLSGTIAKMGIKLLKGIDEINVIKEKAAV